MSESNEDLKKINSYVNQICELLTAIEKYAKEYIGCGGCCGWSAPQEIWADAIKLRLAYIKKITGDDGVSLLDLELGVKVKEDESIYETT